MIGRASAAALVALAHCGTGAAAMERTFLVFAGPVTLNDAAEILAVDGIEYSDATVFGIAGGLRRDLPHPRFRFSMEAQVARYLGSQGSWEVNLVPAMIHYVPRDGIGPLESLGFGLGLSYASEPPAVELARGDETTREKWYWALEAAFETGDPDREYILRIHHRSTGSSTIGSGRSTNAVVIGLRQSF